jgi:hypothetical protein
MIHGGNQDLIVGESASPGHEPRCKTMIGLALRQGWPGGFEPLSGKRLLTAQQRAPVTARTPKRIITAETTVVELLLYRADRSNGDGFNPGLVGWRHYARCRGQSRRSPF